MLMKKGGKLFAAFAAAFAFAAIAWLSCTKTTSGPSCKGVACMNGGYCHHDTVQKTYGCLCPRGFEGSNCSIASGAKYAGKWDITSIVVGTDSPAFKNYTQHYILYINQSPTPTTFLMNNWGNDQEFNNVICTIDSTNSYHFWIDTLSPFHLNFEHYKITSGDGMITKSDSLVGNMITRHLSATSNWINDTFNFYATKHGD